VDSEIVYDERGLVPCIVQDWSSGEVLTLAYMNALALERTRATGELHLWSRSRGEQWHKGGHVKSGYAFKMPVLGHQRHQLRHVGRQAGANLRTNFHRPGPCSRASAYRAQPAYGNVSRWNSRSPASA